MNLNYPKFWQQRNLIAYLLLPLAGIFYLIITIRKLFYQWHFFKVTKFSVPVIVVGNVTVGGTGKTPFVIWLANNLKQQGKNPGIVSRGYMPKSYCRGGLACPPNKNPRVVEANSNYHEVGDEALIIKRHTQCPMVIASDRVAAVKKLLKEFNCDIVISDDGLQHYALGRDKEIILIDGERRFGNGFLLPAGPLREPIRRLGQTHGSAPTIIINGIDMQIEFDENVYECGRIIDGRKRGFAPTKSFVGQTIHAVAGIGNPQRFFAMLEKIGIKVIPHPFPDHHQFLEKELNFADELPIIMTEKDAVKCEKFPLKNCWYLPIKVKINIETQDIC